MEFFDLVNISEQFMELINPTSTEKIRTVGKFLRLREGSRVLDFGCGFAEPLVLWAEQYGIRGIGIDVRPYACERANRKIAERNLAGRLEIVCTRGADYPFTPGAFDAVTCIGASFVFGGFRQTLQAMRPAIHPAGRLAIGEPYWIQTDVPHEIRAKDPHTLHERQLLAAIREQGFDLDYVVRASQDDWDRYEAENWHGLVCWLEQNPAHPENSEVAAFLRKRQDDYIGYERDHYGWAMYVLAPSASLSL